MQRTSWWMLPVAIGWLSACQAAARPAAVAPAPRRPALAPEMRGLSFYVGEWQCRGVSTDEKGARHPHGALRVSVVPVLDGTWLEVRVFENGVPATSELKGYDRQAHRYRHVWATGDGQSGSLSSSGWEGDHMVFHDDHPPPDARERATFTRVDDTHYSHRSELDTGGGYRLAFEKTCRKRT